MGPAAYAVGVVWLVSLVASVAVTARLVRLRFFRRHVGDVGLLVDAVLALAIGYGLSYVLGSVGLFSLLPLVGVVLLLAYLVPARWMLVLGRPARPEVSWLPRVSLVLAAVVAVQWTGHVVANLRTGIHDGDTLWYHGPFAARFVQDGWLTRLHFTHGEPLVTFFPANSEVATAWAILPFGNDVLVPFVNLGWLALALLAGWCIGRRDGVSSLTLAATAVIAALPVMASTQAGSGRNDIAGIALLLAAVALVRESSWERATLALAGVATGLAIGVKVSMLAPLGLLALAVLLAAPKERRRAIAVPWLGSIAVAGSFWFVRNLVRTGNPLPWFGIDVGPVELPSPPLPDASIGASTIASHLDERGYLGDVVGPGLTVAFGPLWPLLLALALGGGVAALARGRTRFVRLLGASSLAGVAAYVVTPNSSPGEGGAVGNPILLANFFLNARYAAPALALGLVAGALVIAERRWRARPHAMAALAVLVLVAQVPRRLQQTFEWPLGRGDLVLATLAVVATGAALWVWRRRGRTVPIRRALAGAAFVTVVGGGFALQRWHLDHRYTGLPVALPEAALYDWAQEVGDARIAVGGDFFQYPFYGRDLSNHVQFVGDQGPHGAFEKIDDCRAWRQALADGDYDFVVLAPQVFFGSPELERVEEWTSTDPSAQLFIAQGPAHLYRLDGEPSPESC